MTKTKLKGKLCSPTVPRMEGRVIAESAADFFLPRVGQASPAPSSTPVPGERSRFSVGEMTVPH